jgi:alkyl hydroperoxide reductase subunit AhpF
MAEKTLEQYFLQLLASEKAEADAIELAAKIQSDLDAKDQAIADLENQVAELKAELTKEQESNPTRKEQFDFQGKTYEILVKDAKIPGVSETAMTALEICNSDAAKEKLVKRNSGLIREIK